MQSGSMPELVYNTELDWQERALHYGDGLFETLLKFNHQIPLWREHFDRLRRGCERLSIPLPAASWLEKRIADESRELENAVIKIIVSRGRGGRGLQLPVLPQASVFVLCYPWSEPSDQQHRVSICKTRLPINPNLAGLKHLNRLDYVLAAIELEKNPELTEGIICDIEGFVIEGLISNLFFIDQSCLYTPSLDFAGVAGIMRQLVIEQADKLNLKVNEGRYTTQELLESTECFLCNSVRGITPIVAIDQQHFIPGDYTRALMAALNRPASID